MIEAKIEHEEAVTLFRDTFDDDRSLGEVIGTQTADGMTRLGIDAEGVIGIDHGALRIQPMIESGWGRTGLAYGPYQRENGLAFCVFMLNGHNTSQLDVFTDTLFRRLRRWAFGGASRSDSKTLIFGRMAHWLLSDHPKRFLWYVRWWHHLRQATLQNVTLDENLAVGWFPQAVAGAAMPEGDAFVMHALGAENGELWATGGDTPLAAVRSMQNVPFYTVVILREQGAAFYAASFPNAFGLTPYPEIRPLAIEPFRDDPEVYAGIHQSVLGQIGFRSNTRVYGTAVARLPQLSEWYGTAHAADSLTGGSILEDSIAEMGGGWQAISGAFRRTSTGVTGAASENVALLSPGAPSGLLHALVEWREGDAQAGLVWRAAGANNYWGLLLRDGECHLRLVLNGKHETVATSDIPRLSGGKTHSVQILDDGKTFAAYLNGALLFDRRFDDMRLASAESVGIFADDGLISIRDFEAHPRTVTLPAELDLGTPWYRTGQQAVVTELFDGAARTLDGKPTTTGAKTWARALGKGFIDVLGDGSARVRATTAAPNPGRTAFTVAWDNPQLADLELEMVPPGAQRGDGDKGRCGLIFWQDADNYIIVNVWLDDGHPGVSISSFFRLNGFEEIYDAVWTMMPRHVTWGQPFRLRVVFDGVNYLGFVNDESVLYRALTDVYPNFKRLSINRVGLVVNWEWGDDTGTTLRRFVAKV